MPTCYKQTNIARIVPLRITSGRSQHRIGNAWSGSEDREDLPCSGASAPWRRWPATRVARVTSALTAAGWRRGRVLNRRLETGEDESHLPRGTRGPRHCETAARKMPISPTPGHGGGASQAGGVGGRLRRVSAFGGGFGFWFRLFFFLRAPSPYRWTRETRSNSCAGISQLARGCNKNVAWAFFFVLRIVARTIYPPKSVPFLDARVRRFHRVGVSFKPTMDPFGWKGNVYLKVNILPQSFISNNISSFGYLYWKVNVNVDEREGTFTPRQMFYLLHLSLIIFATLGVWIER